MSSIVDVQIACEADELPTEAQLKLWVDTALHHHKLTDHELTIRIVDAKESRTLNHTYRGKDKPTNVLSFPFEVPDGIDMPLLGDLVVSHEVLQKEAIEQNKKLLDHWAHIIIHGTLHLLGYDHIEDHEAEEMEGLEIHLLAQLSIDDPYQDH